MNTGKSHLLIQSPFPKPLLWATENLYWSMVELVSGTSSSPLDPLPLPQRLLSKEDPGSAAGEEWGPHPLASLIPDPKHRDSALERVGMSLKASNRMPLPRGFAFIASNCGDTYAPGHY